MPATVRQIVISAPAPSGTIGQYTALQECRLRADATANDAAVTQAATATAVASATLASSARDQAVAAVGAVKVTAADAQASVLSTALTVAAPLVKAVQNPGGDESLLLSVQAMAGATGAAAGSAGLVPAPAAGSDQKYLRGDATWQALDKTTLGLSNVLNVPQLDARVGTAKGDLLVYQGSALPARLGVGSDGQALVADSTQTLGVKWATPQNAWNPAGAFTRATDATFGVTDNAANQDIFRVGRPLRFRQNSATAWQYAMVRSYAAGTVTLAGAALTAAIGADAGREMQTGDMVRLHTEALVFNGQFADSADAALIANDLLATLLWPKGKAYLVHFMVRPKVDDTGAAQSRVNVTLSGAAVCTANGNAGLSVIDTAWTATTTDISTTAYGVALGQSVEVSVDNNSTNHDARDLTLIATFVLE